EASQSFSAHDLAQSFCEISLHKQIAHFRNLSVWKKDALRIRPLREYSRTSCDVVDTQLIDREPIGKLNRRLHDFCYGLGAKLIQGSNTCIEYSRHRCGERPRRWNQTRFCPGHASHFEFTTLCSR